MKLPEKLQRLFYRYHADRLDTTRHALIIIPTVLADGTLEDWDWLFDVYGWNTLQQWIREPLHARMLPPAMERFWTLVLDGVPRETPRWQGGNALRRVPPDALPDWFPTELR
ncbi:hypothetical protein SAMN00768000_2356 [Sulfobacillus thermosulfidooxidans DSM 9293]|uniref:DUF6922 domain-containing protein n=1 Tax=Sulfobacillus thermosulfidooxidans (strain DSM 9293 / VKM B-1269 / AT-1) TaxID=929705 RepID=A0A1W1WH46_SULTA|nr:hypothetical protein [Sulfobacillus thermosulfidooxidans]SMC05628.1 hypothetical protein SAMN00768000_2356 [Sulfobacillus thermosulfidooxidans DSM 9293]